MDRGSRDTGGNAGVSTTLLRDGTSSGVVPFGLNICSRESQNRIQAFARVK